MLGLKLADRKLQYIIIFSLIALGIICGVFIGLQGIYKPLIALSIGIPFLIITINRPWIAVAVFFLLIPLDSLYVLESSYNATATKFVGAYLVFLILLTGKLKYISEVFKNKKVFWIIGFVLAAVISTVFSQISSIISINLIRLFIYLVLYFALVLMIRDIKTLSYCIYALIAGGVISILSPLLFGIGTVTFERYGGLWGDQNGFAAILITIIPLSLVLYLNKSKRLMKIIAGAGFVIMLAGFFLTYSRGGFIAFLALSILTILKML